jgi:hypothetical protein
MEFQSLWAAYLCHDRETGGRQGIEGDEEEVRLWRTGFFRPIA